MKNIAKLFAAAVLAIAAAAQARPISFIYTGTSTGTIGTATFSNTSFTITEQSDTSDVQSCGGSCLFINALSTTIDITGVGSFNFTTGTRTFAFNDNVGFSRAGAEGLDLYDSFVVPGYDLLSAIGPVNGSATLVQWGDPFPAVTTNGGVLVMSGSGEGSFEARIEGGSQVPEAGSMALLALGIGGLAVARVLSRADSPRLHSTILNRVSVRRNASAPQMPGLVGSCTHPELSANQGQERFAYTISS